MTTKPPSAVKEFPPDSLEKIAYNSVSRIPAQEPNDLNRLGYHVLQWLKNRTGSLEDAIRVSGSRIHISRQDALKIITEELRKQGVQL
jgi:hypothetical protein